MWPLILLAVLATTPGTASFADANVATLKKLCAILGEMKSKTMTAELMQKLSGDTASYYSPRISCSETPNSDFGFMLEDVAYADCMAASASKMTGLTVMDFPCEGYAPVLGSGGKQVLWGFSAKLQTASGESLDAAVNFKYTFGEDGKIVAYDQNMDTAPMDNANVATLKKLCTIAGEIKSKTFSAELMQKLSGDMASFYAPRISCSATRNSDFGFMVEDVPFMDCMAAATSKMTGMTVVDFPCEGFAPVVGTRGKQVLWSFSSKVQTASGETLEVQLNYKYTFGEDGKIVAYDQNWDTAPFDDANVATVKKLCDIEQQMIGKVVSQGLMARLAADVAEHYAPTIDCSSVSSNTKYGYALKGGSLAECLSKEGESWEGYEITAFDCGDIASVARSNGKKIIWSTTSHIMTPVGELVSTHIYVSYAFDNAGRIVAQDQTFDTFLFSGGVASAHMVGLTAEQPQWEASTLIAFAIGCIVGPATMLGAMRIQRQHPPARLEGYQECDA